MGERKIADTAVGRCRCGRGVAVTLDVARSEGWQLRSECCGRWIVLQPVRATLSTRACGPHCADATGTTCRCECGGTAHGVTWRVSLAAPGTEVAPVTLLEPPVDEPASDPQTPELAGIRWGALGTRREPVAGEVALFDVPDPGRLQEW